MPSAARPRPTTLKLSCIRNASLGGTICSRIQPPSAARKKARPRSWAVPTKSAAPSGWTTRPRMVRELAGPSSAVTTPVAEMESTRGPETTTYPAPATPAPTAWTVPPPAHEIVAATTTGPERVPRLAVQSATGRLASKTGLIVTSSPGTGGGLGFGAPPPSTRPRTRAPTALPRQECQNRTCQRRFACGESC